MLTQNAVPTVTTIDVDLDEFDPDAPPSTMSWRPLLDVLKDASVVGFSGRVTAAFGGETIGAVVFQRGRVAWAVSRNQAQDLGTFLVQVGSVTPELVARVRSRYLESGGRITLVALLEQERVLCRSTLRKCLLLHARAAIESLASSPVRPWIVAGALAADEDLTFSLEEVLGDLDPKS